MTLINHTKEGQHFEEWVYRHNDKFIVYTHFVDPQPNWNVFVTTEGGVSPITNMWDYEMYHPIDDENREWYIYKDQESCSQQLEVLLNE